MNKHIELHSHLGSLVNARDLWKLSKLQGLNIGIKNIKHFESLIKGRKNETHSEYLSRFNLTQKIQSSPLAIMESVYLAVESAYNDGLDGIEIRFNPMLRNKNGYFDLDSIIYHACQGLQKGISAFGIKAGLIISTDRTFTADSSEILANKAMQYEGFGVIGFDCSGKIDGLDSIYRLGRAYESLSGSKIKKTIHTGEIASDYVTEEFMYAVDVLGVDRIGHGIQYHNYPSILSIISDNGICLEICPTSNVHTGVIDGMDKMKLILENFFIDNVKFTINTDGNVFLKTNINKEVKELTKLGIDKDIIDFSIKNSHRYNFIK